MAVAGISHGGVEVIGWGSVPVPFATLAVILRFTSRARGKQLGCDDWCMLGALILYYCLWIAHILWATVGKLGYARNELDSEQFGTTLKIFYFANIDYFLICLAIQLSCLLPHRKMFLVKTWIKHSTILIGTVAILWAISAVFIMIFQCSPITSFFNSELEPRNCIDLKIFYRVTGCLHIILDVVIFALPMPIIWKLKTSVTLKLRRSSYSALGFLVCVASILRLISLWDIYPDNISSTFAMTSIWTSVQVGMGIICGCSPTFRLLYDQIKERRKSSRLNEYSQNDLAGFGNQSNLKPPISEICNDSSSLDSQRPLSTSSTLHIPSSMGNLFAHQEQGYGWDMESGLGPASASYAEEDTETCYSISTDGSLEDIEDEKAIEAHGESTAESKRRTDVWIKALRPKSIY